MERKTKQSRLPASCFPLVFPAQRVRDNRQEELKRESGKDGDRRGGGAEKGAVTARQTARKRRRRRRCKKKKEKSEDERLVVKNPRWFVMSEVRHISLGLLNALQECELLAQQCACSTSPRL